MSGVAFNRPEIIGRQRERQFLRNLLASAIAGQGGLVLVSGEAGIGKTTLIDELITHARDAGALVLTGGCYDLTTTPPYGPWTEAIRAYRPASGQPDVPSWFGNLDELEKLGSQTAIFEEARQFFASLAGHQPLLIVLEDLHWTDPASVDTLRYLARNLSIASLLILATYRDDEPESKHPFAEALPALIRESQAARIELRRWLRADTRALIADRYQLDSDDEDRLTIHLHRLAAGNPFYTVEILHQLEAEMTLRRQADTWHLEELSDTHVPPLIRQVVEHRLNGLSGQTRSLLEVASVIGHDVELDLWQEVGEVEEVQLIAAIEEALGSQVIDESTDGSSVEFRHALIRETLYEGVVSIRRRTIHQRVGSVLARRSAPNPDTVADHFVRAGAAEAVDWLINAADRAESLYSLGASTDRLRQAQSLLEHDPDRIGDLGWLIYRVGRLLRHRNTREALEHHERAEQLGTQAGDDYLTAMARYQRGFMYAFMEEFRQGIPLMLEAAPSVGKRRANRDMPAIAHGPISVIASRAPSHIQTLMSVGKFSDAIPLLNTYVVREGNHPDLSHQLGQFHALRGDPAAASRWFSHSSEIYDARGYLAVAAISRGTSISQLLFPYYADVPERIRSRAAEARELWKKAHEGGRPSDRPPRHLWTVDFYLGDWDRAKRHARMTVEDTTYRIGRTDAMWCLAAIFRHQGNLQEVVQHSHSIFSDGAHTEPGYNAIWSSLRLMREIAATQFDNRDPEKARAWLEAHDHWMDWSGAVLGLAEGHLLWTRLYLAGGDQAQARERAGQALACANEPRQPLALIAAHRFLGELDTVEGEFGKAETHLATALQLAERCQAPYEVALVQLALAELALATRDIPRISDLLARARATLTHLEARPALERAERIQTTLDDLSSTHPAGLTAREVEVLCLVANGLSNREIAKRLYLSARTIERHLTNIYRKIGVSNRVEASTFARRHHLTAPPAA